ncbi:MAG: arginine--tRNA ligase [Thermoplasmatales archaeon]|nr:arginine--tRNA ligase [Thermoplasmatales archaeon]
MSYPLNEAEKEVISLLEKALSQRSIGLTKQSYKKLFKTAKLELPPENMGDFAFPCFILASELKKSPNDLAKDIATKIEKGKWVEKIEANGPYVNFFINIEYLKNLTIKSVISKQKNYGNLENKNKKAIIEHTSANPNGPLHVGRARNPIIGDTIVRIYKAAGYDVESQFYLDDMGKQVAILAWGVNNLESNDVPKTEYDKPDHTTVGYYQLASKLMEKDENVSKEIGELVKRSEEGEKNAIDLIHKSYNPVLEGIKESLIRINISLDKYVPESNFVKDKSVDWVIEKLKKSKYCEKEKGAYYLDMKNFGIQGRNTNFFFIRKDGTTLYATRDIAYHLWKAKHADVLVNILGEDHKLESKQVEVALNIVKARLIPKVIFYSFVSLPGGKMSTRHARVVYLDELIDECVKRAFNEVKKRRGKELTEKKMNEIAEVIGIGALRYNIIKVQPEKDIEFKWEEALNFEGNASPFIQYSHARACSILSKKQDEIKDVDTALLKHNSEIDLVKKLARFPIVIDEACEGYKPHSIANYLFDVASQFNQFYRDCPVLPEKNAKIRIGRLALVDATRIVLQNGLNLLGIVAPEEM